jgi:glucose/mannose transport system permease protein
LSGPLFGGPAPDASTASSASRPGHQRNFETRVTALNPNDVYRPSLANRLGQWWPFIVLAPTLAATLMYVVGFSVWTFYISLSNSTLLPDYTYVGFEHYVGLWGNRRWQIAYTNLLLFGTLYVIGTMVIGTLLAILIDQRVKGESIWRTIYLYPLAVSFVVTGTVWRWIYHPSTGVEKALHDFGWVSASFDWISDREMAIYVVVITGIWHASGFAMALILAGLRSVDQDLMKAAQIDGASLPRTYWRVVLPVIRPIFVAVLVVLLQFAIKTYDLVAALTVGGPGISTNVPAMAVYDFMFQRGQIAEGAAGAIMILLALTVVLVPYAFYSIWRSRKDAGAGGHG